MTAAVGPRGKRVQTPQPARTPPAPLVASQPVQPREHSLALAHAAKGVEALGVLVQYLVFRVGFHFFLVFYCIFHITGQTEQVVVVGVVFFCIFNIVISF